jgi:hypothetical protein
MAARSWLVALAAALPMACSATTPGPQAVEPAYPEPAPPEPTQRKADVKAPSPSSAPVAFSPAPVVGSLNGGSSPSVQIKVIEGIERERANEVFTRAATAAQGCAGAGTVVTLRIHNVGTHRDVELDPHTVLDSVQRRCVIDAISTVQLDESTSGLTSDLLHTAERYSAQLVLAW